MLRVNICIYIDCVLRANNCIYIDCVLRVNIYIYIDCMLRVNIYIYIDCVLRVNICIYIDCVLRVNNCIYILTVWTIYYCVYTLLCVSRSDMLLNTINIYTIILLSLVLYMWLSWPWSFGSWIYNYLCNQCLSPLTLWVRCEFESSSCEVYSRQHYMINFVSYLWQVVVFSRYSSFLHQ